MAKTNKINKLNQRGFTLLESMIVVALLLVLIIPLMGMYVESLTDMYVTNKLTDVQREANSALYFIGQDIGGAETTNFLIATNTTCLFVTYHASTVGYYLARDSTIRRVVNHSTLTGGSTTARYIASLKFSYYNDTTFTSTTESTLTNAVRLDILVSDPQSSLTNPNSVSTAGYFVSTYIWCRNRSTL